MDPEELTLERQWLYTGICTQIVPAMFQDRLNRVWANYGDQSQSKMCEIWRIIDELEDVARDLGIKIPTVAIVEEFVARQIWRNKVASGIDAFASVEIGELLMGFDWLKPEQGDVKPRD